MHCGEVRYTNGMDYTSPTEVRWKGGSEKGWEHKTKSNKWVFPKIGVPQNGWFIMENPINMGDLGVTIILGNPPIHGLS